MFGKATLHSQNRMKPFTTTIPGADSTNVGMLDVYKKTTYPGQSNLKFKNMNI